MSSSELLEDFAHETRVAMWALTQERNALRAENVALRAKLAAAETPAVQTAKEGDDVS